MNCHLELSVKRNGTQRRTKVMHAVVAKATGQAEAMSAVKKVIQFTSQYKILLNLEFHRNVLKAFLAALKTLLGLLVLQKYHQDTMKLALGQIFGQLSPNLHDFWCMWSSLPGKYILKNGILYNRICIHFSVNISTVLCASFLGYSANLKAVQNIIILYPKTFASVQ